MQWRKLARSKITSGRSSSRTMLCCGRRKDNGREALDLTASPLRAPPGPANTRNNHPPPMVIQGDFRKVSGISTEIFKQIETVENDHDASTAAALEHVERRGEMIVRILDARQLGRNAGEAAKRFLGMQDAKHTVQFVEIVKRPGQTLGLYIREGNGIDRGDGVFISRIALESAVYNSGCLKVGDEILAVNLVDVTRMSLDDVVIIMSIPRRLLLATRQRKGGMGKGQGGQMSPLPTRPEHKAPPVVVIKQRDLRDEDLDESDSMGHHTRDTLRQRHTGDGREMTESRSRLGLGLDTTGSSRHMHVPGSGGQHHHQQQQQQQSHHQESNGLDLYYNSRPPGDSISGQGGGGATWGYQPPPPPVITEQPKGGVSGGGGAGGQHFQTTYERSYPGTLESLAEKVHAFGMPNTRRMSAGGGQTIPARLTSQQSPSSHYYIQHSGTGSRRIMPRSGSDQHLPHTEYADYTSITQAGRHSLLRSSLKSGSTLSRYNQRYVDQAAVAAQIAQAKYGTSGQYTAGTLTRRNRSSLDYSSDTEATCGPRSSYYYYGNRNQPSVPHSNIPAIGRANPLTSTDITTKFNSLPRDTRGGTRLPMNKRYGDNRGVSLLTQDEADGNISAPEMPSIRHRDEYRQWLSRTPSTSAIYEQIRASRDVLNQQRAARFTYSAENIHAALKDTEGSYYSSYSRPGTSSTLDRSFSRPQQQAPSRSLSTQHITTSALASTRSPSIRRMRQLLDLDTVRAGAPSPVPTPSGTLPRGQRQLDINPAEFLKYKIDKPSIPGGPTTMGGLTLSSSGGMPGGQGDEPVSGMLWVHLLAGRGLRVSTGTGSAATTPVTPSGGTPSISSGTVGLRDLYCVLECDRVHKARTVVRTGDLVFDWDESFELDLVYNRELDLLIYSWDPQYRHKLCYKGSVHLPSLLKSGPLHQLALKIEPRGTLYLRLRHTDTTTLYRRRGLSNLTLSRTTPLFGVDLESVVNRDMKSGASMMTTQGGAAHQHVPVIIRRCIEEIERRGLDIIGLYRLCGSATKKRILREAFERNCRSVDLTPDNVPDINVITGVLKDYLRELPEPLFTKCLYQMMVDALGVCLPDDPEGNAKLMFSILDCLPRMNRATLIFLMDHLALVVSASDRNKMSAQNLATALAPPLMLHSAIEIHQPSYKAKGDVDYTQPIGVLKYLLQIWPTPKHHTQGRRARPPGPRGDSRSVCPQASGASSSPAAPAVGPAVASVGSAGSREPSRLSAGPYQAHPRSVALGPRGPVPPVPLQQIQGQSSVSKGPYRPLSPRVGPPSVASQSITISHMQSSAAASAAGQPSAGGHLPPGAPSSLMSSVASLAAGAAGSAPSPPAVKPRQVIVSSPGSPSSSSGDSQSGSDSVKHCLPTQQQPSSNVTSMLSRGSVASPSSSMLMMRNSPSASLMRHSPATTPATSVTSSTNNYGSLSRASPSLLHGTSSRSSSPAMQASSAGMAVTLSSVSSSAAQSFASLGNNTTSNSSIYSDLGGGSSYLMSSTQPTTYASTNPFLTGAYMTYTAPPTELSLAEKYSTSSKDMPPSSSSGSTSKPTFMFTDNYDHHVTSSAGSKYSHSKPTYESLGLGDSMYSSESRYSTLSKYQPPSDKYYTSSGGHHTSGSNGAYSSSSEMKYNGLGSSAKPSGMTATTTSSYLDSVSPNAPHGNGHSSGLLVVEETPTPTSSIETEDSNTREVGERDEEGDGEQSD